MKTMETLLALAFMVFSLFAMWQQYFTVFEGLLLLAICNIWMLVIEIKYK